ncbi:MAG: zf-HC2 domain-containing protein [Gemmatimonadales bacterium]
MTPPAMDCAQALALLQDYLKQEITPEVALRIREHLADCHVCFEHSRFEENFLRMLHLRLGRQECPDALRQRVQSALRREQ